MMELGNIREIVSTYERHGWMLRRFLLTSESKKSLLGPLTTEFGGIPVIDSALDAAWFSRPPADGGVAWELRYLGATPYALVESVDENRPDFEEALNIVELQLKETLAKKEAA